MKKILFLYLSLTAFVLTTSCSNDDDAKAPTVQGKWNFHSDFYSSSNNVTPSDSDWYIYENDCNSKDYVEFRSNGTAKVIWYNDSCVEQDWDGETWSLDGNILFWSSDGWDNEYEILELTNTTLKLKEIRDYGTYYRIFKK